MPAAFYLLPYPCTETIRPVHGVTWFYIKGGIKFIYILERAVYTILAGSMYIS